MEKHYKIKTQVRGYHIHFKIDYRQSVQKEHTVNKHHTRRMSTFLKQIRTLLFQILSSLFVIYYRQ